jgi:hypothetical protein
MVDSSVSSSIKEYCVLSSIAFLAGIISLAVDDVICEVSKQMFSLVLYTQYKSVIRYLQNELCKYGISHTLLFILVIALQVLVQT